VSAVPPAATSASTGALRDLGMLTCVPMGPLPGRETNSARFADTFWRYDGDDASVFQLICAGCARGMNEAVP